MNVCTGESVPASQRELCSNARRARLLALPPHSAASPALKIESTMRTRAAPPRVR